MKPEKLVEGAYYLFSGDNKVYEFGYMSTTGYAICYPPGDRGGGMQSSTALEPETLTPNMIQKDSDCPRGMQFFLSKDEKVPEYLVNYHEVLNVLNSHYGEKLTESEKDSLIDKIKKEIEQLKKFKGSDLDIIKEY